MTRWRIARQRRIEKGTSRGLEGREVVGSLLGVVQLSGRREVGEAHQ